MSKSKEDWATIFSKAKYGHILWDGNAPDPYNPKYACDGSDRFISHGSYLGFFQPGNKVLDLGCGNGRFGISLSERLVEYEGIDPMEECIQFCNWAFKDFPHLKFQRADIYNPDSNPHGRIQAKDYVIPFADNYFDDIICYSVFTHLETIEVASHYMDEINRVLKSGGHFFITCYRSPPDPKADTKVGRTVFLESDIMNLMHGFKFLYTYGGHTGQFYDQWGMFCQKL